MLSQYLAAWCYDSFDSQIQFLTVPSLLGIWEWFLWDQDRGQDAKKCSMQNYPPSLTDHLELDSNLELVQELRGNLCSPSWFMNFSLEQTVSSNIFPHWLS